MTSKRRESSLRNIHIRSTNKILENCQTVVNHQSIFETQHTEYRTAIFICIQIVQSIVNNIHLLAFFIFQVPKETYRSKTEGKGKEPLR